MFQSLHLWTGSQLVLTNAVPNKHLPEFSSAVLLGDVCIILLHTWWGLVPSCVTGRVLCPLGNVTCGVLLFCAFGLLLSFSCTCPQMKGFLLETCFVLASTTVRKVGISEGLQAGPSPVFPGVLSVWKTSHFCSPSFSHNTNMSWWWNTLLYEWELWSFYPGDCLLGIDLLCFVCDLNSSISCNCYKIMLTCFRACQVYWWMLCSNW